LSSAAGVKTNAAQPGRFAQRSLHVAAEAARHGENGSPSRQLRARSCCGRSVSSSVEQIRDAVEMLRIYIRSKHVLHLDNYTVK